MITATPRTSHSGRVLVVGGGPAGSLAGTLLARSGFSVTIVEQHRFPRDKVCGECLSALGLDVLGRHGLAGPLQHAGRTLTQAELFGRNSHASLKLPAPMLGVSRALMDQHLLSAAEHAGVTLRQPARVEAVAEGSTSVEVRVRDLISNQVDEMTFDFVLLADGRGAWLLPRPAPSHDLGIKAHFTGVKANAEAITLYGGLGCYGGVAPIEGQRWNVAFAVPRPMVAAAKGDLKGLWESIVNRSSAIGRHFQSAVRVSDWIAAPLPRHPAPVQWKPRVIPIGAAACAIEPVGGEGMGTALRSAELAAAALVDEQIPHLPNAYRKLWQKRSLFCRLGGAAFANADWSDSVGLVRHPAVARAAMSLVGK